MVARIGVSRTPVRAALLRLAEEGLLEPLRSGGFAVKAFTDRELLESIEIRGVLEGLAARLAAERGVVPRTMAPLRRCLAKGKAVVLGLVTSKTGMPEKKEFVKRRIDEAAKFAPLEQLCLGLQCGFASTEEGYTLAEDEQCRKLEMIVDVVREVSG